MRRRFTTLEWRNSFFLPSRSSGREAFMCSCVHLAFLLVGQQLLSIRDCYHQVPTQDRTSQLQKISQATVGLTWWAVGMCLGVTYFAVVYRLLKGKVTLEGAGYDR